MKDSPSLISNYFSNLSKQQHEQINLLYDLYSFWNERINLISRKDMDHFYEKHVLHSLAIAHLVTFQKQELIVDVGTGGGFPGIPLAIMFPDSKFVLVDSITKKTKVVSDIISKLHLQNAEVVNARAETLSLKPHIITSRATAPLLQLTNWCRPMMQHKQYRSLITLKGGDLEEELKPFGSKVQVHAISDFFKEEFFNTKKVVVLQAY